MKYGKMRTWTVYDTAHNVGWMILFPDHKQLINCTVLCYFFQQLPPSVSLYYCRLIATHYEVWKHHQLYGLYYTMRYDAITYYSNKKSKIKGKRKEKESVYQLPAGSPRRVSSLSRTTLICFSSCSFNSSCVSYLVLHSFSEQNAKSEIEIRFNFN